MNAIMILDQTIRDIHSKIEKCAVGEEDVRGEVEKIGELRLRYLNDSRTASPKNYDY